MCKWTWRKFTRKNMVIIVTICHNICNHNNSLRIKFGVLSDFSGALFLVVYLLVRLLAGSILGFRTNCLGVRVWILGGSRTGVLRLGLVGLVSRAGWPLETIVVGSPSSPWGRVTILTWDTAAGWGWGWSQYPCVLGTQLSEQTALKIH